MIDAQQEEPEATVHCFDQVEQLQETLADAFCELIEATLEQSAVVRVSLSGGSTPKRFYEWLSQRALPWDQIHWFWGDERNVREEHPESNAGMVRDALLGVVEVPRENVHAVPVNVDEPAETARSYELTLRRFFPEDAFPKWDLILLGMGDDAHTASLFPNTEALRESQRWFVSNWVEKLDSFRYTLTAPAINSAKQSWFVIAGDSKRQALSHVWNGPVDSKSYPSQLIRPTRWYLTSDALPGQEQGA